MKGPVEYNKVGRDIDFKILEEAIDYDYRPILKIIVEYFFRFKTPPSFNLLKEELSTDEEMVYLISIIEEQECNESEILFYIDKIRKRYNSELAMKFSSSIARNLEDIDVGEFNANLKRMAAKVEKLKNSSVFSEGNFSESAIERFNDYQYLEANPDISKGVMSGYPEIDDYVYGIKPSELMLIVGGSSTGKSLLMMNYAINAWRGANTPSLNPYPEFDNGKNILFFTLEMSKKQIEKRMDANLADIRHKALSRGYLTDEEKLRWKNSLTFQKKYDKKFHIVDMPRGSRVLDIEARYETVIAEFRPDLVVVDYLGIMKPNHDSGQDWLEVGQVAADLHEFCRSKEVAVLSAAQMKAKNKNNKNQKIDVEDIGRSKMIGDNANIVLMLESREDEMLRDDSVIHIVKNRDGEKGEIKLFKDFEKSRFVSIPDHWALDLGDENAV